MDDTDTLLVMLKSLVNHSGQTLNDEALLITLVECDGDVEAAAARIINKNNKSKIGTSKKRKRPTSSDGKIPASTNSAKLDGWITRRNLDKMKTRSPEPICVEDLTTTFERDRTPGSSKTTFRSPSPKTKTPKLESIPLASIFTQSPKKNETPTKHPHENTSIPRLPPLTLTNPAMISTHTPCTLHPSILPPELACQLFYTMLDASRTWSRNKWWLFDRVVESPHRTSFYARNVNNSNDTDEWQEAAQFWYNGRKTDPPNPFPPEMEAACVHIEKVVNEELAKRQRYPLEYGGNEGEGTEGYTWRANVAASNCYEGAKESVGFHSDQLTYLGPYPTIASLSLGTTRVFRLREVVPTSETSTRHARTFNIPLSHNSLLIMHASTQERFKHTIPPQPALDMFHPPFPRSPTKPNPTPNTNTPTPPPPPQTDAASNCRINITFRFYRPDFRASTTPRCRCNVPTILRPDMKNRQDSKTDRYWWTCYAGAQNDGKGCGYWKVMDVKAEGRGPFVGDRRDDKV